MKTDLFSDPFCMVTAHDCKQLLLLFSKSKEQKCLNDEFIKTLLIQSQDYLP